MWMVLLLLSVSGEDAPASPAAKNAVAPQIGRCENARVQSVDASSAPRPAVRSLRDEPLANRYRTVVRHAHCDRPVIVSTRIGDAQR